MRFLQCTLFHGAHDWVQPSPVIIQLNIKIRNFWRKKKKASQFPPKTSVPSAQHIQFLRPVLSWSLVLLFLQRFPTAASIEIACLSRQAAPPPGLGLDRSRHLTGTWNVCHLPCMFPFWLFCVYWNHIHHWRRLFLWSSFKLLCGQNVGPTFYFMLLSFFENACTEHNA